MALPLENFVQQLEDSGILAGDTLKDFIPPKATPKDAEELARELVRKKKLTKFQAEEAYKGKAKSLVLGNYVLMEKIGAGGMGQVFKAEHRRMHRIVAVKVLPASTMKDPATVARFEREVTAAAKLRHSNIVAADDADCANGIHFLVMEMVEGSDLSALVKKNGPFSVEKAVNYVLQAAKGLEFAHHEGVVHRDIKPANLLLDKKGVVKILDMGLARLNGDGDAPTQAELTSTGTVMGTVDYMAPEQALNTKTADSRADIYALGCSLYYLLTGKATYDGDTLMAKLLAHRDQPIPSLRATCPDMSEEVEGIFQKMVAKTVQDRYQTMTEVIAALEQCGPRQEQSISTQQSLISSAETGMTEFFRDISIAATKPVHKKKVAQPLSINLKDKKKLWLIGGGILGVLILLAGLMVTLQTKDGTLVVTVNEPDAEVQVLNEEGKVEISQKGGKGKISISVDPGKHRLKVSKDGFELFTQEFSIEAKGKEQIAAKLIPLEVKPAVVGKKPVPVPAGEKKPLAFTLSGFEQWVKDVQAMPAEQQVEAVAKKLVELNPGFDGKVTATIANGVVTEFGFPTNNVIDISPARALVGLKLLGCHSGKLIDLSPLQGMQLTHLNCGTTQVSDLSPLKGMKLVWLFCQQTHVSDLSPLEGMPLASLTCFGTQVSDLSPLKGMPLNELHVEGTQVSDISPLKETPLKVLRIGLTQVSDLSPLKAMPLTSLNCMGSQVSDLSPLVGMPLEAIWLDGTLVSDFTPLKDMPLKTLILDFSPERDTELLRSIKTLETINGKPVTEFWKEVEAQQAAFEQWMKDVQAMPAEQQVEAVSKKLVELNPRFDGKVTPTIHQGVVTGLQVGSESVSDLSPVRAFIGLTNLQCEYTKVADLSPLKGMPLTNLRFGATQVSDLSPLKGMPLTHLSFLGTPVSDLSPLKDMKLTHLECFNTQVADLSPLKGLPLVFLHCHNNPNITDLSPLKDMPIQNLICDFKPTRDAELLRSIKTLEKINNKPATDFWKEVEGKK